MNEFSAYPLTIAERDSIGVQGYSALAVIASPNSTGNDDLGGAARPVYIVRDNDLRKNGGRFVVGAYHNPTSIKIVRRTRERQGGPALPVYLVGGQTNEYWVRLINLFGSAIVFYAPLWESAPTITAEDIGPNSLAFRYVGTDRISFGDNGIGDGYTAIRIDGSGLSIVNLYSLTLTTKFNPQEGAMFIYFRPNISNFWTDAAVHNIFRIEATSGNVTVIRKDSTPNGRLLLEYTSGNAAKQIVASSMTSLDWTFCGVSWSLVANECKGWLNGVQSGATLNALGTWPFTTLLDADRCVIGARNSAGANPSPVQVAHALCLNRAPTAAEVAQMVF